MSDADRITGRLGPSPRVGVAVLAGLAAIGLLALRLVPDADKGGPALVSTLDAGDVETLPLAFSPDGTKLAAAAWLPDPEAQSGLRGTPRWRLVTRTLLSGETHAAANLPLLAYHAVYSPDGTKIAVLNQGPLPNAMRLSIFDAACLSVVHRSEVKWPRSLDLRFSPDASRLELIAGDPFHRPSLTAPWEVLSWDAATWKEHPVRPVVLAPSEFVAFCSGSRTVATADRAWAGVTLHDINTGAVSGVLASPAGIVGLQASPDGRWLAVGKNSGAVEVWDLPSRTLRTTLRGHTPGYVSAFPHCTMFAADGRTLVSTGFDQTTPSPLTTALRDAAARFGRKRDHANSFPETLVWEVATGRVLGRLYGNVARALSADARKLATLDDRSRAKIWDLTEAPRGGTSRPLRP